MVDLAPPGGSGEGDLHAAPAPHPALHHLWITVTPVEYEALVRNGKIELGL